MDRMDHETDHGMDRGSGPGYAVLVAGAYVGRGERALREAFRRGARVRLEASAAGGTTGRAAHVALEEATWNGAVAEAGFACVLDGSLDGEGDPEGQEAWEFVAERVRGRRVDALLRARFDADVEGRKAFDAVRAAVLAGSLRDDATTVVEALAARGVRACLVAVG